MTTAKRMSVQDIIRKESDKLGADFGRLYTYLYQEIQAGRMRILRHGNSLLIYTILEPGVAEAHIVSADNPVAIVKAIKEFDTALRRAGFERVVSDTQDEKIIKLLKTAGVDVKTMFANGVYNLEFEV